MISIHPQHVGLDSSCGSDLDQIDKLYQVYLSSSNFDYWSEGMISLGQTPS